MFYFVLVFNKTFTCSFKFCRSMHFKLFYFGTFYTYIHLSRNLICKLLLCKKIYKMLKNQLIKLNGVVYTAQLLCFISFSLDYFLSLEVLFLFHRFLGFTVYQYITGFLSWLYKSNLNLVWPILDYSRSEIFNFDSVLHIYSIIYIHLRVSCNFLLLYFVLINIKMDKQKMQCLNC